MGYADSAHYSHYANFNEIQAQLKRHDQYQERYRQYSASSAPHPTQAHQYAIDPRAYTIAPPMTDPHHLYSHRYPPSHQHQHNLQQPISYGGTPMTKSHSSSAGIRSVPQTPLNQMGYLSQPNSRSHLTHGMIHPGSMSAQPNRYGQDYPDYDRGAYTQHSYGSLPRRTSNKGQNGIVSGPAQV